MWNSFNFGPDSFLSWKPNNIRDLSKTKMLSKMEMGSMKWGQWTLTVGMVGKLLSFKIMIGLEVTFLLTCPVGRRVQCNQLRLSGVGFCNSRDQVYPASISCIKDSGSALVLSGCDKFPANLKRSPFKNFWPVLTCGYSRRTFLRFWTKIPNKIVSPNLVQNVVFSE